MSSEHPSTSSKSPLGTARYTRNLATGPIGAQLARLSFPMLAGISSVMVAAAAETVFVGWLGTDALATLTFATAFLFAVMSVAMGLGMGVSSLMSRTAGEGDLDAARDIGARTLLLALGIAVVVGIGCWYIAPVVFRMQGVPAELESASVEFARIWLLGLPFLLLPMVAGMMLRALGDAVMAGIFMVAMSGIQIAFAPPLMFGIGDWEGAGINGAAWASVFARLLVCFALVRVLGRAGLYRRLGSVRTVLATWFEVLRLSVPVMASNLIVPIYAVVIIGMTVAHGASVVAGIGVAMRVEALAIMVFMALASAMAPMVGQNFGCAKFERVGRASSLVNRFCLLWGLLLWVLLVFFGPFLLSAFTNSQEVVRAGYEFLAITAASYGLFGISMVAGSSFVAIGRSVNSLVLSLLRTFAFVVPLAYLLDLEFGFRGLCVGVSLGLCTVGAISFFWFRSTMWRLSSDVATS